MPIGERIKELRLKNDYTLDEIAEQLGTSRQTIFNQMKKKNTQYCGF